MNASLQCHNQDHHTEAHKKMESINFESVITDSVLAKINTEAKEITFKLPSNETLELRVQRSREQWLVIAKHLDHNKPHSLQPRSEIKANGYLLDNATQICKHLREFMKIKAPENSVCDKNSTCEIFTVKDGFHGWCVAHGSDIDAQQVIKYGFKLRNDRLFPDSIPEIKALLGSGLEVIEINYHKNTRSSKQFPRVIKIKRAHRPFITTR